MRDTISSCRPRRALLIDLDNIAYDHGIRCGADTLSWRLHRIVAAAGPLDYKMAIAPAFALKPYVGVLARLGLPVRTCVAGPDSADRDLCLDGVSLVERGFRELFVASGDHYFACLATVTELTIVVPRGKKVSKELLATSRHVAWV